MPGFIRYFLSVSVLCGAGLAEAAMQQQAVPSDALPGHLYVEFTGPSNSPMAGKSGIEEFDRLAALYGVTSVEKAFPSLEVIATQRTLSPEVEALRSVYLVRYAGPHPPLKAAYSFGKIQGIGYAEPIYKHHLAGGPPIPPDGRLILPDDPFYPEQVHLDRMRLPEAWDVVKGEDGSVVIAIVDGGTAWQHEDLMANVWTNPREKPGTGRDDDFNGFVDDMHGWNFPQGIPDPTGPLLSSGTDHGTNVAGAAAAVTNNKLGLAGTSWNARFMPVNINCAADNGLCYVEKGILYAGMNGADIITASFGSPYPMVTAHKVIRAVLTEGALVVAATGNGFFSFDSNPLYPAAYNETLSVGGLAQDTDEIMFSIGGAINVFAPGMGINVPTPTGYSVADGTSLAVPLTAGVAALVKTAHPSWGPERIREQIRLSTASIEEENSHIIPPAAQGGRVDAYAAVTQNPLPAIRVVDWSLVNQDGEPVVNRGDRITLTVTYKNVHGDADGVVAKLTTEALLVNWDIQEVSLGAMSHGATAVAEYRFTMTEFSPWRGLLVLYPELKVGTRDEQPDVLRIRVNDYGFVTHNTDAMRVSVTDEGNIGHTLYPWKLGTAGEGFMVEERKDEFYNWLEEGGLLIATSPDQVSDCIHEDEEEDVDQQKDFVVAEGSQLEFIHPGARTYEESRVLLTDAGAANPIGVEVLQESFVHGLEANEDFIILHYTVKNTSGSRISNVHVGLYMDWDLSLTAYDIARFDEERQVGYVVNHPANEYRAAGTVLLTESPVLHYRAIDNMAVTSRWGDDGGFLPQEKWDSMTGGVQDGGALPGVAELSQLTAAGPFELEPNESVEVAFALVVGLSAKDFLANVDHAKNLWSTVVSDVSSTPVPVDEWTLHAPYPNPATFPTQIRFDTGSPGTVEVAIYDVLGRRVRQLMQGARTQGEHTVTWDGRNEQGTRVSSGLYLVRMLGEGNRQPVLRSQPILVLH